MSSGPREVFIVSRHCAKPHLLEGSEQACPACTLLNLPYLHTTLLAQLSITNQQELLGSNHLVCGPLRARDDKGVSREEENDENDVPFEDSLAALTDADAPLGAQAATELRSRDGAD